MQLLKENGLRENCEQWGTQVLKDAAREPFLLGNNNPEDMEVVKIKYPWLSTNSNNNSLVSTLEVLYY